MRFRDFNYDLPQELIAQTPVERRDASRLMILDRKAGTIDETEFSRITELFSPGDLLVVNDTRVLPARLFGEKESGGRVEVFLLRRMTGPDEVWSCLLRSSKKPRAWFFSHVSRRHDCSGSGEVYTMKPGWLAFP